MGSPLTEVMTMLLQCYCFSTVVKVSNTGLGVVILMLVNYEYSAFSVQLWWLQTAAAPVTGRQISAPSLRILSLGREWRVSKDTLDRTNRLTVTII